MEAHSPIEFLKNKLAELKTIPGVKPNLIVEYEKAVLILELIGSTALGDKINESNTKDNLESNHDKSQKGSISYFEKFMKAPAYCLI
jgi:hypothetical protein